MCSFVYGMGLQPADINHNNLAGYGHHFLFFHVRLANQPTIPGVDLCHKTIGRPWFTETRDIRYQPLVLVHNARFHSECYTIDKDSNKTCENNIILPTNIAYLEIHVRNWIWSQTSQWYTNSMKWTWGDKLQRAVIRTRHHHFTCRTRSLLFGVFSAATKRHGCNLDADYLLRQLPYLHSFRYEIRLMERYRLSVLRSVLCKQCLYAITRSFESTMFGRRYSRGAFIVFEGCDRAGKSTQCRKLVQILNERNVKAEYMAFPGKCSRIYWTGNRNRIYWRIVPLPVFEHGGRRVTKVGIWDTMHLALTLPLPDTPNLCPSRTDISTLHNHFLQSRRKIHHFRDVTILQ
jgi:hypothetical protein